MKMVCLVALTLSALACSKTTREKPTSPTPTPTAEPTTAPTAEPSPSESVSPSPVLATAPEEHRAEATACGLHGPGDADPKLAGDCKKDKDCKGGKHARCVALYAGGGRGPRMNMCETDACDSDADCKGGVCDCGGTHICVAAQCKTDADCGVGGFCSPSKDSTPMGGCFNSHAAGYFCHTAQDACQNRSDCANGEDCVPRSAGCA